MKKKKRPLTLLEIMIVILLIGLIGSVIGVNMKGSLEEGKAFKSRQAKEQITDILTLEIARGATVAEVIQDPVKFLDNSGLIKNPKEFIKDGWGEPFEIKSGKINPISVHSHRLQAFENKKNAKLGKKQVHVDEDEATE